MKKLLFILLFLTYSILSFSQEVIVDFEKKSLPVLNEELNRIRSDIVLGSSRIKDSDNDTKIHTEESPDEDIIRMDTAGTERWIMTAEGERTMPTQPAFYAKKDSAQNNITAGSTIDVTFNTEVFDQNGDWDDSGNILFTAPVTGKYQFNITLEIDNLDTAAIDYLMALETSNRSHNMRADGTILSTDGRITWNLSVLADMDAGDTAKVTFRQTAGANQTDLTGGSFSGFLVS